MKSLHISILKKSIFFLLLLVGFIKSYGQVNFGADMVNFPSTLPSASVSSFPTYTDIPVDNATGIPNISYPLLSLPTRSSQVSFNMTAGYHPNNISYSHKSSEIGLGWSLFGGGDIGRVAVQDNDERINNYPGPERARSYNDEYYYNFSGYSGKFKMVKDTIAMTYSIVNFRPNNLKFQFTNGLTGGKLGITSFTIIDGMGISWVFGKSDLENSYRTSWHLTSILDAKGTTLAELTYLETYFENDGSGNRKVSIWKLQSIASIGLGSIAFNYTTTPGLKTTRNDMSALNTMILYDYDGNQVRSAAFTFTYMSHLPTPWKTTDSVRFLTDINLRDKNAVNVEHYGFEYYNTPGNTIDRAGFCSKTVDYCDYTNAFLYEGYINPTCVMHGALKKVILPTGGRVEFNFEANKATMVPYQPDATDFADHNLNNDDFDESSFEGQDVNQESFIPLTPAEEDVYFGSLPHNNSLQLISSNDFDVNSNTNILFSLPQSVELYVVFTGTAYNGPIQDPNISPSISYSLSGPTGFSYDGHGFEYPAGSGPCSSSFNFKKYTAPAGNYVISITSSGSGGAGNYTFYKKVKTTPYEKWDYAGGLRIASVNYYDSATGTTSARTTTMAYEAFDDVHSSSGQEISESYYTESALFKVLYKNVQVTEGSGSGYTRYHYYTPYDKQMSTGSTIWPHYMILGNGLLNYVETFDNTNTMVEYTKHYYGFASVPNQYFLYFPQYMNNAYASMEYIKRAYTKTQRFYYNPAADITEKSVTVISDDNFQVSSQTRFDSNDIKERVSYYYPKDLISEPNATAMINKNMVEQVLKTSSFKNDVELSSQKVLYKDWGSGLLAPEYVQSSKGGAAFENRAVISKYDEYGHVLEVAKQDGAKTSFIWGYHKTQPVAKAENMAYNSIPSTLITNLQAATDLANNETNVITALSSLRNDSALATALVTGGSMKLLTGASTIVDPKGDKSIAIYDSYGRLQQVKDRYTNILSEYAYVYGTPNSVKTTTYKKPTLNGTTVNTATPGYSAGGSIAAADKTISITYVDGLGRAIQQNVGMQSASGYDIVTHIEYDSFGRKAFDFMPYATTQTTQAFITPATAKAATLSYYNAQYADSNAYSQKAFELSPLSKVLKQSAPGAAWAMNSGHEVRYEYKLNTDKDIRTRLSFVKRYEATATWNSTKGLYDIAVASLPSYPVNTLYATIIYDENHSQNTSEVNGSTIEYKDKSGKVILKRRYGKSVGNTNNVAHDTYYVYDQYGNLTCVIPPNAPAGVAQTMLDGLCYQYKYDARNRLVEKKLPGKQWEFIVYDKLDRVVASGPTYSPFTDTGLTGTKGWMINKYDALNRAIITGWYPMAAIDNAARKDLQDKYNLLSVLNESKSASDNTVSGVAFRYTNTAMPSALLSAYHVLTVNYFDNYSFTSTPTFPITVDGQNSYYDNSTTLPKGMPTGSWVRVPQASTDYNKNFSYPYYDYKGRVIRNYTQNYLLGYHIEEAKFDFVKVLNAVHRHKRNNNADPEIYNKDFITYTDQDRVLKQTNIINSATETGAQLMAYNTYNELGQLINKKTGGTNLTASTYYQKVDYTYNIRGWLKAINNVSSLTDGTTTDLFAFKINYDTTDDYTTGADATTPYTGQKLFNGNISEVYWRTANDNITRKYGYVYDDLNRMTAAIYMKPDNSTPKVTNSYNESVTYDRNGNIMTMKRNGNTDLNTGSTTTIDDLQYTYETNTNKLVSVLENSAGSATLGFKDGATAAIEYDYDAYGNMTGDLNKGIPFIVGSEKGIVYNHLGLPLKVTYATGTVEYTYDATGTRMKKVITSGSTTEMTDYLYGWQYKNSVLQFFPTSEGYVKNTLVGTVNKYNYVFQYKDHLGNVRVSYAMNNASVLKIMEENNYYPFGMKHDNYNTQVYAFTVSGSTSDLTAATPDNQYKFGGKELQPELMFYDFGARNYDPALGRWMNIDPLAEISRKDSPYVYALNNPVVFTDPDGMTAQPGQAGIYYDWDTGGYVNSATGEASTFGEAIRTRTGTLAGASKWMRYMTQILADGFTSNGGGGTIGYSDIINIFSLFNSSSSQHDTSNASIKKPNLVNSSHYTIFYKPEKTGDSIALKPGDSFNGDIDGIAVPHISENKVFKFNDFTYGIEVTDIEITYHYDLISYGNGWKNESWLDDIFVNKNDVGWINLFISSGLNCASDYWVRYNK